MVDTLVFVIKNQNSTQIPLFRISSVTFDMYENQMTHNQNDKIRVLIFICVQTKNSWARK